MSKGKKPQILTRAVKQKLYTQFLILQMAFDMDEELYDGDPMKLMAKYAKMVEYFNAMENHLLTVDKAKKMVEEYTGITITLW